MSEIHDDLVDMEGVEDLDVPEIKIKTTPNDSALKDSRYQKLIELGLSKERAEAGSVDGQAFLAARIFHRGI